MNNIEMSTILVGTYNMSFAGDLGLDPNRPNVFESEAAFHKTNKTGNLRQFWLNALENVKKFVSEDTAGFIGLQEITKTAPGSGTGSDAITTTIESIKPSFKVITERVETGSKPAITIAWDSAKLGEEVKHEIKDLMYMPDKTNLNANSAKKIGNQVGRPMLMVLTNKGYLLISLHAPNYLTSYKGQFSTLRNEIQYNINNFVGVNNIDGNKVFIVGDFNDRLDALKEITVNNIQLKYKGKAPRSCCHNWDSTCTEGRFEKITDFGNHRNKNNNNKKREDIGTCRVPTYAEAGVTQETIDEFNKQIDEFNNKQTNDKAKIGVKKTLDDVIATAGPGFRAELGKEGNIENYRYYADKVFGAKPAGDIRIFPPGRAGKSNESDHEMVVAEFTILPNSGGRRRRGSKTRRSHSSHKTRRHSKVHKHRKTHHRRQSKKTRRSRK